MQPIWVWLERLGKTDRKQNSHALGSARRQGAAVVQRNVVQSDWLWRHTNHHQPPELPNYLLYQINNRQTYNMLDKI